MKSKILVEFHGWQIHYFTFSLIIKVLRKKFDAEILSYSTLSNFFLKNIFFKISNSIKWIIGNFLNLKTFKIFKSIGVEKLFKPDIKIRHKKKAELYFNSFFKKTKITKFDVCNFKVKNILVGDILYDSFLKTENFMTIDLSSKVFKEFVKNFLSLFFFWEEYFLLNKIKAVVVCHATYLSAIPLRFATMKGIKAIVVEHERMWQLNKENIYTHKEYYLYKKIFKSFSEYKKKKSRLIAKKAIQKKINGKIKIPSLLTKENSFKKIRKNFNNKVLTDSNKFKVLISPHSFFDAPHERGNFFFADFYEWIIFLFKISSQTNHEWYIKFHSTYGDFFDDSCNIMKNLIKKKYKTITWIDPNISNKQLSDEGINVVLTVHGSVGSEFPFLKIPVVNASINNPHIDYKFNVNPLNLIDYCKIIKKLPKIKNKINQKELLEYFYMHHLYFDYSWMPEEDMTKIITRYKGMKNVFKNKNMYKILNKQISDKKKIKIKLLLEKFFNTDNYCLLTNKSDLIQYK
jgi:hypothetical protein